MTASQVAGDCRYEPGKLEQEWFIGQSFGNICNIARRTSQIDGVRSSLAYARSSWGATARAPSAEERSMLSRLVCDTSGGGAPRTEYLEPLTGIARHPLSKVGCHLPEETDIFDISHLVLANRCNGGDGASSSPARRRLLYDLGCSTYSKIPLCELHPHHRRCTPGTVSFTSFSPQLPSALRSRLASRSA